MQIIASSSVLLALGIFMALVKTNGSYSSAIPYNILWAIMTIRIVTFPTVRPS